MGCNVAMICKGRARTVSMWKKESYPFWQPSSTIQRGSVSVLLLKNVSESGIFRYTCFNRINKNTVLGDSILYVGGKSL